MNEPTQTGPHSGSFDLMIAWLGGRDEEKVAKAASILLGIGQPVVEYLIREANKPGKRSQHRIAILDVIRQSAAHSDPTRCLAFRPSCGTAIPVSASRRRQVIMAASPCGVPKSPEGLALMRAFNPYLTSPARLCPPRRTRLTDFAAALRGDQAAIRRRIRSSAAWQKREEREQGRKS